MIPPPRAILFDWDNTLADNWAAVGRALNAALAAFGMEPWTDAEIRLRVRASLRDSFPSLFGAEWERARAIFYDAFAREHLAVLRPLPGAEALLRRVAATGTPMAVVSNKQGQLLRLEAAALGWTELFHRLVGAQDAAADKPDPAAPTLALAGSGISLGPEVWFVGDTAIDMACARNAGMTGVLVGAPTDGEDFRWAEPHLRAADLPQLEEMLADALGLG